MTVTLSDDGGQPVEEYTVSYSKIQTMYLYMHVLISV